MKKFIFGGCILLSLGANAFADMDIKGLINGINPTNHTINVSGTTIQILPHTKIEGDDCGAFGSDTAGNFASLREGMFVEVDAIPSANGYVAEDVTWKCGGNRAY